MKTVAARIKVLAGLDITERRLPQDGRIGFNAGKREVDLRVSTLPANRGEKIALRILEAGATRKLQQIFYEEKTLSAVRRGLDRPYGGIIVGGPTGSGKTSTLYAMLNERRSTRPDTNILTVEDPIEYRLQGVTQVQVSASNGLTFARALRSLLRQDPDGIVVGETRDQETAVLALEAAMTGHLLLTSIHANTAVAALQRLENLGCSRALVSQSVALVLVQRLVRRLCAVCRKMEVLPAALAEALVVRKVIDRSQLGMPMPIAFGCEACNHTGQAGRAVVVEALTVTDELRNALGAGRPLAEVEALALQSGALLPFASYAAALLGRHLVGATEILGALAE
jgi:type IV pilus assembly protein PilB